MLPMPGEAGHRRERRARQPGHRRRSSSSASSSSSPACIAAPSVAASASSTGLSATRWRSTQPLGPTVRERGGERGGEAGLADHEGLRGVRELLELLAVGGGDRRLGPALERDPLGGLARHLPVDRSGRLQHPHHLAEVDLREVEVGGVEVAARTAEAAEAGTEGREVGGFAAFVGLFGVSRLRRVGHAVSVWGCIPSRSPAPPASSGRHLLPVLAAHPDVDRVLGLDVREPERRPRTVEFARVDIAGTELKPLLEGIDVVVHLAGVVDPVPDVALMARVNVEGTRHVLDAAASVGAPPGRAHLERHGLRRVGRTTRCRSPRTPPLRPNPTSRPRCRAPRSSACSPSGAASHPDVTVTTLRSAPVVGPGRRAAARRASCSAVRRCACAARRRRCRWCTSTTSRRRSRSWPRTTCPASYNVAADGWLDAAEARELIAASGGAGAAGRGARALLERTWELGIGDVPPGSCRTSCTRG